MLQDQMMALTSDQQIIINRDSYSSSGGFTGQDAAVGTVSPNRDLLDFTGSGGISNLKI